MLILCRRARMLLPSPTQLAPLRDMLATLGRCVSPMCRQEGTKTSPGARPPTNFKRLAAARAVVGSSPSALPNAPAAVARPRPPIALQAGMLAAIGLSDAKFGRVRASFCGADGPMASFPELRKARATLLRAPANEVDVDDSGAHRSYMRLAVEARLGQLCTAGSFIERPVYDAAGKAVPKTRAITVPAEGEPTVPVGTPPESMLDVLLSIGLDKGGSPSSFKVFMGLHN